MFVPIKIRYSKKCQRCNQRFPVSEPECVHCKGLSDQELAELKSRINEEHQSTANLGKVFIVILVLILAATFILALM